MALFGHADRAKRVSSGRSLRRGGVDEARLWFEIDLTNNEQHPHEGETLTEDTPVLRWLYL